MKNKKVFPYPERGIPTTKDEVEKTIENSLPYSGDTLYERATGRMTFPLKDDINSKKEVIK